MRVASTQLVSANSSGWPMPRSVASERAATTSARWRAELSVQFGVLGWGHIVRFLEVVAHNRAGQYVSSNNLESGAREG